jgi:hypothetical protein
MSELSNLEELLEEHHGMRFLNSSSSSFLSHIEDEDHIDLLVEIEHQVSDMVYDSTGLLITRVINQLKKDNAEIISLSDEHQPFKHALKFGNFHVYIQS